MKLLPRAQSHPPTAFSLVALAIGMALAAVPKAHAAGSHAPVPVPVPASALASATAQVQTPNPAGNYTPKPKETLDQVIEKTMSGSPLKIDLLRQAFYKHNPQAFVAGSRTQLKKGVALKIPDHNQLLQEALHANEKAADAATEQQSDTSGTREERRQWVRYP